MELVQTGAASFMEATEFVQFAVSFFSRPGNKNVAGETPWLPLKPPQPTPFSANPANRPNQIRFHFNLTAEL